MAIKRPPFDQDLETSTAALRDGIVERRAAVLAEFIGLNQARVRDALREHDLAEAEGQKAGVDALRSRAQQAMLLTRAAERSRIPAIVAHPEQAVLHGRVVNMDADGVEGRIVVVSDARGREAARTTSAELGYFKFVFPPTLSGKPPKEAEASQEVQVRLEVRPAPEKGDPVRSSELITLTRGKVIYRELSVP